MPPKDDAVLNLFEWHQLTDEVDWFDVKRAKSSKPKEYYFLLLDDDILPFDKEYWDLAMQGDD